MISAFGIDHGELFEKADLAGKGAKAARLARNFNMAAARADAGTKHGARLVALADRAKKVGVQAKNNVVEPKRLP